MHRKRHLLPPWQLIFGCWYRVQVRVQVLYQRKAIRLIPLERHVLKFEARKYSLPLLFQVVELLQQH